MIDFWKEIEKVKASALKDFNELDKGLPDYLFQFQRIEARKQVMTDFYLREIENDGGTRAAIEAYANSRCISILMERQFKMIKEIEAIASILRWMAIMIAIILIVVVVPKVSDELMKLF